jgi:hypothetical protein
MEILSPEEKTIMRIFFKTLAFSIIIAAASTLAVFAQQADASKEFEAIFRKSQDVEMGKTASRHDDDRKIRR